MVKSYGFNENSLKPLSTKKLTKYDFVGFDVETLGVNNDFYLGGVYFYNKEGIGVYKSFYDRKEMISYLMSRRFQGKQIVATNLAFDFTKLFWKTKEWNLFKRVESGGQLLSCIYKPKDYKKRGSIKFIDTTNYVFFSVEKLGKILGIKKLEKPSSWKKTTNKKTGEIDYIPQKPENRYQINELETYNKRDCKISCDFLYFLQDVFNRSGGNIKITIASTSFDIWRRNFLKTTLVKEEFVTGNNTVKNYLFKAYYGGRTEAFGRGNFKKLFYYDINSLYPSVMANNSFPLPNSVKLIKGDRKHINYIKKYEGVSTVKVKCPDYLNKPFLPIRINGKLIFPTGVFTGTYNHCEIRMALKLGYNIISIVDDYQVIYTKTFKPFKEFVEYFYSKRQEYKKQGSVMELPLKLVLNSLYGKFGQKKITDSRILDINHITNKKDLVEIYEKANVRDDGTAVYNEELEYDGINTYPILSSYTSSYARILMYPYINKASVKYTDTDSIMSTENLGIDSKLLGEMKLEGVYSGVVLKPKMYKLKNKDETIVKCKGIKKPNEKDFTNITNKIPISKSKLFKLRESLVQKKPVYSQTVITKKVCLNDDKRFWIGNESIPLKVLNETSEQGISRGSDFLSNDIISKYEIDEEVIN